MNREGKAVARYRRIALGIIMSLVGALSVAESPVFAATTMLHGVVVDVNQHGIGDAIVRAYGSNGAELASAATDRDGRYSLAVNAEATVVVAVEASGYATEFFNNSATLADATPIPLAYGLNTEVPPIEVGAVLPAPDDTPGVESGRDNVDSQSISLAEEPPTAGTISGKVTLSDGTPSGLPASGAVVKLERVDGTVAPVNTTADTAGAYTFGGVTPGSYRLLFTAAGTSNYVPEYWRDAPTASEATAIEVVAGATQTFDAQLQPGGSISGTVTSKDNLPLANVTVTIADTIHGGSRTVQTNQLGKYFVNQLTPSSYRVTFSLTPTYAITDYFAAVGVDGGQQVENIDISLRKLAVISGKLVDARGAPLPYTAVTAKEKTTGLVVSSSTDSNGEYRFPISISGTYIVSASKSGYVTQFWRDALTEETATGLPITGDEAVTGINLTLAALPDVSGAVSGRVTNSSGAGIPNVSIQLSGKIYLYATTDASGNYSITKVPDGKYAVDVSASGYIRPAVQSIEIVNGTPIANLNYSLATGGTIAGRITTGDGGKVENMQPTAVSGSSTYYGTLKLDGTYEIKDVPPGDYKVKIFPYSTSPYKAAYYGGATVDTAAVVVVTAASTVQHVDITVQLGATVSGKVTNARLEPLANVSVSVASGSSYGYGQTDTNGDYTIRGLTAGIYTVRFAPASSSKYIGEWYDDLRSAPPTGNVTLVEGSATPLKDAVLSEGFALSGTIRKPDGTPLGGANVSLTPAQSGGGTVYKSVSTGDDGTYTIVGVATGNYCLTAYPAYLSDYTSTVYGPNPGACPAEGVVVVADKDQSGLDIQVGIKPTLSGRVTDELGNPLEGVPVALFTDPVSSIGSTKTDAAGNYILKASRAAVGAKLRFGNPEGKNYIPEYYDNVTALASAKAIDVKLGDALTGYDAKLAQAGTISGTVTGGGAPLAKINVYVSNSTNSFNAVTDEQGKFTITQIPAGSYRVQYSGSTEWKSEFFDDATQWDKATLVEVTGGGTATANADLARGAALSVTVTDPLGKPVKSAPVDVIFGDATYGGLSGSTSADGKVTFGPMEPGTIVRIRVKQVAGLASEWFKDSVDRAGSTPVTLVVGATPVEIQLGYGATVKGRLTGSDGAALAGATVSISNNDASGYTTTDADGNYSVSGLLAGDYSVYFRPKAGTNYVPEYYKDQYSWSTRTPYTVIADSTSTLNAELAVGATLSGQVTGNGAAIPGAGVTATRTDSADGLAVYAQTDASGNYSLVGLAAGTYALSASPKSGSGFSTTYYVLSTTQKTATPIVVAAAGTLKDYNIALGTPGSISGVVTDESGKPLGGATVKLRDVWDTCFDPASCPKVTTAADGSYRFEAVSPGPHVVRVDPPASRPELVGEYFDNIRASDVVPTEVAVGFGANTVVNVQLDIGGVISGTVTDDAGVPLKDVIVDADGHTTKTDAAGNYEIIGLAEGKYTVSAEPAAPWAKEFNNDKALYRQADPVTVAIGKTTNVGFKLSVGATVRGTVTGPDGKPLDGACVTLDAYTNGLEYGCDAFTKVDGTYEILLVHPGDRAVCFWASDLAPECHDNKVSADSATRVSMAPGATVTVDAALGGGGSLVVKVVNGIKPVSRGNVWILDAASGAKPEYWNSVDSQGVDVNGRASIPHLAPGRYVAWYTDYVSETEVITASVAVTIGDGQNAEAVIQLSTAPPVVPAAPAVPSVVAGDGSVTLTWSVPADGGSPIVGYVVEYRVAGGAWVAVLPPPTTSTATVTGLANGTAYEFRVAATNAVGQGPFSTTASVTPAAPVTTTVPTTVPTTTAPTTTAPTTTAPTTTVPRTTAPATTAPTTTAPTTTLPTTTAAPTTIPPQVSVVPGDDIPVTGGGLRALWPALLLIFAGAALIVVTRRGHRRNMSA